MSCVETVKLSLHWNGKKLEWFHPSRGTRQGDPISPYLFVLCMERLGHIINSGKGQMVAYLFIQEWSSSISFVFC